jgi:hypothetical protein
LWSLYDLQVTQRPLEISTPPRSHPARSITQLPYPAQLKLESASQIAEQLYVTQRTVETHLTRAFQKLDITSRTELASHLASPASRQRDGTTRLAVAG